VDLTRDDTHCICTIRATNAVQVGLIQAALSAGILEVSPRHFGMDVTAKRDREKGDYVVSVVMMNTTPEEALDVLSRLLKINLTPTYKFLVDDRSGTPAVLQATIDSTSNQITFTLPEEDTRGNRSFWLQFEDAVNGGYANWTQSTSTEDHMVITLVSMEDTSMEALLLPLVRLFSSG
jgi:hypothetical protein